MVNMIGGIYRTRKFVVQDGSTTTAQRTQAAGIAQGCLRSPYLFIIVMSVILRRVDVRLDIDAPRRPTKPYLITKDVLYADDTMLISRDPDVLQAHLDLVVDVGELYGLELNAGKTVLLKIRADGTIYGPDGQPITCRD
eukprot:2784828-Pyramimonas_sp.AAC.1